MLVLAESQFSEAKAIEPETKEDQQRLWNHMNDSCDTRPHSSICPFSNPPTWNLCSLPNHDRIGAAHYSSRVGMAIGQQFALQPLENGKPVPQCFEWPSLPLKGTCWKTNSRRSSLSKPYVEPNNCRVMFENMPDKDKNLIRNFSSDMVVGFPKLCRLLVEAVSPAFFGFSQALHLRPWAKMAFTYYVKMHYYVNMYAYAQGWNIKYKVRISIYV